MKFKFKSNLFLGITLVMAFSATATQAATRLKSATGTDLTVLGAWDALPTSADIATWTTASLGTGLTAATGVSWAGINISDAASNVGITGAGSITLGSPGITLTGNKTLTVANAIVLGSSQIWSIADATGTTASDATFSGAISGAFGLTKSGAGTMTLSAQSSYTGGTTVNAGILNLTGGGGANGTIRGTATVNTGGTLRLSTGDATGYNGGASSLNTINLAGGTLDVNTASNQTLGSAIINMTGGSITGIENSNLDFFGGGSKLNTLASATTSTISGVKLNLRQGNTTFSVADGAAAIDLDISSVVQDTYNNGVTKAFIKAGTGTMRLTGVNTYSQTTAITGGTLALGGAGSIASSLAISIANGATLDVSALGTSTFTLGASKNLSVGAASGYGSMGTATLNGNLSLTGPNTLNYSFGQGNTSDTLALSGGSRTLTFGGTTTVAPAGGYVANGTYTLITGATTVAGTPSLALGSLGTSSRGTTTASFDTTGPAVTMTVTGNTPVALAWKGTASTAWDVNTTSNWQNPTPAADTFYNLDTVTFSDSPTTSTVVLGGAVSPGSVTFNNTTATAYTFSGVGSIAGGASVSKTGNGTVFFTNTGNNTYSGGTTISAGTLSLGNGTASTENVNGLGTGAVTINTGGTLQLKPGGSSATFNIANNINLNGGTIWAEDGLQHLTGTVNVGASGGSLRPYWDVKSLWIDGLLTGSGALAISTPGGNTDGVHFANPANTYSGIITVSSSNAKLDSNTALSNATIIVSATNGLQFNTGVTAPVIGGLAGASNESIAGVALTVGNASTTNNYSGILSGAGGSVIKVGMGTQTLSGINTYSGGTTVSSGELKASAATTTGAKTTLGSGSINVNAATVRFSTGSTANAQSYANAINLNGGTLISEDGVVTYGGLVSLTGSNTVNVIYSNKNAIFSNVISGSGSINLTGSGTTFFTAANTYNGNTAINSTTLEIGGAGQLNSGAYAGAISNGGTLVINSTANQTLSGIISGGGGLTKANTGTLTLTNFNSNTGNVTVNGGVLDLTGGGLYTSAHNNTNIITVNTGGTLKLNSFSYGASSSLGTLSDYAARRVINGGTIEVTSGTESMGNDFTVGNNGGVFRYNPADTTNTLTLTGNANTNIPITGALTLQADGNISVSEIIESTGRIIKTGARTLTLSGTNTYSGGTTLSTGTLVAANSSAFGSSGTITLNDASTSANNTALMIDATSASITIGRAITVANQGSGTVTIGSATTSGSNQAIFSGAITLAKNVTLAGGTNGDRLGFTGGIGGTGNVSISGPNRVLFSGTANSYAGTTAINAGASLQLSDGSSTGNSLLPDDYDVSVDSGAYLKLAKGTNSETIAGLSGAGSVQNIVGGITSTLILGNNNASGTFSGVLENPSGTLALTKTGSGTQVLSGSNTYAGNTAINGGTLQLGNGSTTGSLSTSSAITNNANLTINRSNAVAQGTDFSAAAITGTGSVTAAGTGTITLSSANSYSGGTFVNAGADLRIDGAQTGDGTVDVAATGKLGGSGSVIGGINVSGVLAPGNSIDSLGAGTLAFTTGSTYAYELQTNLYGTTPNSAGDLAYSSGTLSIAGGTILTLQDLAASTALLGGSKLTLISSIGAWNGGQFTYLGNTLADDSTFILGVNEWQFNYNDLTGGANYTGDITGATSFVTMTVVPEPGAALLGGIGMLALLRRRR